MPFGVDDDVDLIEYLQAILRYKYRIVLSAVAIAGVVFGLSLLVDNQYMSTAVVAVDPGVVRRSLPHHQPLRHSFHYYHVIHRFRVVLQTC